MEKTKTKKYPITCDIAAKICAESIMQEHFLTKENVIDKIKNHYRFIIKLNVVPKKLNSNDIEFLTKYKQIDIEREFWKKIVKENTNDNQYKNFCELINNLTNSITINTEEQ